MGATRRGDGEMTVRIASENIMQKLVYCIRRVREVEGEDVVERRWHWRPRPPPPSFANGSLYLFDLGSRMSYNYHKTN